MLCYDTVFNHQKQTDILTIKLYGVCILLHKYNGYAAN